MTDVDLHLLSTDSTDSTDLLLFSNSITAKINERKAEFQLKLCDLQSNLFMKIVSEKDGEIYTLLSSGQYSNSHNFGL